LFVRKKKKKGSRDQGIRHGAVFVRPKVLQMTEADENEQPLLDNEEMDEEASLEDEESSEMMAEVIHEFDVEDDETDNTRTNDSQSSSNMFNVVHLGVR